MTTINLTRWSGIALLLAGILFALGIAFHPGGTSTPTPEAILNSPYALEQTLAVAGVLLSLFGLIGLYSHQKEQSGWLGFIGFCIAFTGSALFEAGVYFAAYVTPTLAAKAPELIDPNGPILTPPAGLIFVVPIILTGVGYILLGIATLRAHILPRWGAILLMIGSLTFLAPPQPLGPTPWIVVIVLTIIWGVGMAWLGYALWSQKGAG